MRGPHYKSTECKCARHSDCDGYVPRKYDEPHDHLCDCNCGHGQPVADKPKRRRR